MNSIKGINTLEQRLAVRLLCHCDDFDFRLAKRPEAAALKAAVTEFLRRVEVLPWDDAVAQTYGTLRAQLQGDGTPLGSLGIQIAAHALHAKAVLVSSDKAFQKIAALSIQDWTLQVSAL